MAGITSTKKIKGQPHLLAYITPNEVEKLKALGGQETITKEGIPAYPEFDNYTEDSLKNTSSAGSGLTRDQFEGGAYSGTGNAGDGIIQQYDNQFKELKKKEELAAIKAEEEKLKKEKEEQRKKDLGITGPLKINYKTSYFDKFKKNVIQKKLNRDKLLALKKMNLTKTLNPFAKVPDWAKDLTEEELVGAVTTGPYLGLQKTVADVNEFASGKDLLGRVFEGQSMLNTDNFPQSEYERLFPNNLNVGGGNGGGQGQGQNLSYIPGLGDTGEEEVADETTFDYHLGLGGQKVGRDVTLGYLADGGRITRAGGGIMNAVPRQGYFLGGIGKAIKGVVGGVADAAGKVLKSDIGKMAIAGAAFYYGGGGSSIFSKGAAGTGGFTGGLKALGSNFMSTKNPLLFNKAKELSLGKLFGVSTVLPYLFGEAKQDPSLMATRKDSRLIDPLTGEEGTPASMRANIENAKIEADGDPVKLAALNQAYNNMLFTNAPYENYGLYANGGRIKAQEGGLMNLGGMEKDYRAEGGFVPIGREEKADDVPARLSVNEFVFTADAVRNAGGGDIDKGAEVMENMMKNLENGGRVSEESQGNTGAQEMFSVSERIGEVI